MARLTHPNVITVHEIGEADEFPNSSAAAAPSWRMFRAASQVRADRPGRRYRAPARTPISARWPAELAGLSGAASCVELEREGASSPAGRCPASACVLMFVLRSGRTRIRGKG